MIEIKIYKIIHYAIRLKFWRNALKNFMYNFIDGGKARFSLARGITHEKN